MNLLVSFISIEKRESRIFYGLFWSSGCRLSTCRTDHYLERGFRSFEFYYKLAARNLVQSVDYILPQHQKMILDPKKKEKIKSKNDFEL